MPRSLPLWATVMSLCSYRCRAVRSTPLDGSEGCYPPIPLAARVHIDVLPDQAGRVF